MGLWRTLTSGKKDREGGEEWDKKSQESSRERIGIKRHVEEQVFEGEHFMRRACRQLKSDIGSWGKKNKKDQGLSLKYRGWGESPRGGGLAP